jgi:predicted O-methyltransferase YrrM
MGATTLAIAQALPADGKIFAFDTSKEFTDFGVAAWHSAGVREKIDLRLAPAADSLQQLIAEGAEGTIDFGIHSARVCLPVLSLIRCLL